MIAELRKIVRDIRNGALSVDELPGFLAFMLGRLIFFLSLALIACGVLMVLGR